MLTRLKLKKDFRVVVRFLSDKPPENDGKSSSVKETRQKGAEDDTRNESTKKINLLLKNMIENYNMPKPETDFSGKPVRKAKVVDEFQVEKIEENLTEAASKVAKAIGGNTKETESELLSKVLGKINQTPADLSKLLIGMKINRGGSETPRDEEFKFENRGDRVKRMVGNVRNQQKTVTSRVLHEKSQRFNDQRRSIQLTSVDVFSGTASGIFSNVQTNNYGTKLDTWEELEKRELKLATAQPPANYFQKMIMWTEQGKVWKFPINNEQGLEEEEKIHFSEHVFLDAHLEGWCPTKGPIRHFMELVCTGLSKNSFYTSQEKKEHIMWYKEYFESKQDILKDVGVWFVEKSQQPEA